jgi:hypothetical protein
MRLDLSGTTSRQQKKYERRLKELGHFVDRGNDFLIAAVTAVQKRIEGSPCLSHGTILAVCRNLIERIDGIAVLARAGSTLNTYPLLRTTFETLLGLQYMLESDTLNRALAYQVRHAHRSIAYATLLDPTTAEGQKLRASVAQDDFRHVLADTDADADRQIAYWAPMLTSADFCEVENAWQIRTQGDRTRLVEWYSLFDGPPKFWRLAEHLNQKVAWTILYTMWSDVTHGTDAFNHVGKSQEPGMANLRPARNPEGIEKACGFAVLFATQAAIAILSSYAADAMPDFRERYRSTVASELSSALGSPSISAPWKD